MRPWTGSQVIIGLTYRDNKTHPHTYKQFWVSLILAFPAELNLWPPKSNLYVLEPKRVTVSKWRNFCNSNWHLWHLYSKEVGRSTQAYGRSCERLIHLYFACALRWGFYSNWKCYRTLNGQQGNLQGRGFSWIMCTYSKVKVLLSWQKPLKASIQIMDKEGQTVCVSRGDMDLFLLCV